MPPTFDGIVRRGATVLIATAVTAGAIGCKRSSPKYSDVQALWDKRCGGSSCHLGSDTTLGASLDLSAAVSHRSLVSMVSSQSPPSLRVVPGKPDESYLLCKLDPACSAIVGTRMPSLSGLSASELALVREWIAGGALAGPALDGGEPAPDAGTKPPLFSGVMSATGGPNSVTLNWAPAVDVTQSQIEYLVYQASASRQYGPTHNYSTADTRFVATKLMPATTYFFLVRARNAAGILDSNMIEVSATTLAQNDSAAPAFQGAVAPASVVNTTVTLGWGAASDNFTDPSLMTYLVYRATTPGGQNFATPTEQSPPGASSVAVRGLEPQTPYYFVVRAQDQAGNVDNNTIEVSATTGNVNFASEVVPVFMARCAGNGCHTGANPGASLTLDATDAAGTWSQLVNRAATQCGATRVVPGNLTSSYLYQKLLGSGFCIGERMPKPPFASLAAADLNTIRIWISSGAPQ